MAYSAIETTFVPQRRLDGTPNPPSMPSLKFVGTREAAR
jgi:hypothetical protein